MKVEGNPSEIAASAQTSITSALGAIDDLLKDEVEYDDVKLSDDDDDETKADSPTTKSIKAAAALDQLNEETK